MHRPTDPRGRIVPGRRLDDTPSPPPTPDHLPYPPPLPIVVVVVVAPQSHSAAEQVLPGAYPTSESPPRLATGGPSTACPLADLSPPFPARDVSRGRLVDVGRRRL